MANTWQMLPPKINGDRLTITVQEVVNSVPGNKYSVTRPKNHPRIHFKNDLKRIIKKDRLRIAAEASEVASPMSLVGFETFLNA